MPATGTLNKENSRSRSRGPSIGADQLQSFNRGGSIGKIDINSRKANMEQLRTENSISRHNLSLKEYSEALTD